jgi:hypothetical protein
MGSDAGGSSMTGRRIAEKAYLMRGTCRCSDLTRLNEVENDEFYAHV